MIRLRNTQRTIKIDTQAFKNDAQRLLDLLGYSDFDLGIWITNNRTIRTYNNLYRHIDKPTDVLSFPFYPDLPAGKRITAQTQDEKNLGDLLISAPYVANFVATTNTKKRGAAPLVTFEERMRILLVHGICHLLGYDHIHDADYRRMRAKEAYLLKKLRN